MSEQIVCECELVTRGRLEQALAETPDADLDDIGGGCGSGWGLPGRALHIPGRGCDA